MHAFWFLIGSDSVKQHNKKLPWQALPGALPRRRKNWSHPFSMEAVCGFGEAKFATRASLWPHTETTQDFWLKELWLFVGLCLRPISRADLWLSIHSSQLSWSSETASKRLCQLRKLEKLWHFESKNSNRCLKNLQKYRNLVEAKHHWRFFQALFHVWTNLRCPAPRIVIVGPTGFDLQFLVPTIGNWELTWLSLWLKDEEVGGFKYIILFFHPDPWGNVPIWRAYFSNGLKPPTSESTSTKDYKAARLPALFF